jgi:hypothetical protein
MGKRREAGGGNPGRDRGDFENGAGRGQRGEQEPVGFAADPVGGGDGESGEYIKPEEILYAFTAGAVAGAAAEKRVLAIVAKWVAKFRFPQGVVFLRTRKGIYRSYLRTLREFKKNVPGRRFEPLSRSVVANLEEASSVNLGRQRIKTLSYAVDESDLSWALEFVTVSREYLPRIRECFAMPKRLPPHTRPDPAGRAAAVGSRETDRGRLSTGSCSGASEGEPPAVGTHRRNDENGRAACRRIGRRYARSAAPSTDANRREEEQRRGERKAVGRE